MKMKWMAVALALAAVFAASSVQAEDVAGQLVRFKTGEVSFSLLKADGVTPMKAAELKMLSPDDSRVLVEAVSDNLGKAIVALAEGRYLLNVSGRTLSVLEVAADATITACRVVIPDAALMVAGQEEDDDDDEVAGAPVWLKPVVIGGVLVLVAGGAYAIYDHNDDDDDGDDDGLPPPPPPPPPVDDDDDDDDELPPVPPSSDSNIGAPPSGL